MLWTRKLSVGLVLAVTVGFVSPGTADAVPRPAAPPAPDVTGPYAVGRTTIEISDPARDGRTLTVDVWYPSDAEDVVGTPKSVIDLLVTSTESPLAYADPPVSDDSEFPLVVFSHGSGGIRFQSWFLSEHLASHGFVVAAPDHAGNTALDAAFGTTTPFATTARNRPLDVSFVIDQMLARDATAGDRFGGTIDEDRIAVMGHSFGGFTALAMASGYGDIPADPRVDAIVPIAPASGLLSDDELGQVTVPMLLLGGTSDTTTPIVPNTTRPWELTSSSPRYRVDVDRAGHSSFTNICDLLALLIDAGLPPALLAALIANAEDGCAPDLQPIEEVQRLTNLYSVAFLERVLNDDGRYQRFLTHGYARSHRLPVTFLAARQPLDAHSR